VWGRPLPNQSYVLLQNAKRSLRRTGACRKRHNQSHSTRRKGISWLVAQVAIPRRIYTNVEAWEHDPLRGLQRWLVHFTFTAVSAHCDLAHLVPLSGGSGNTLRREREDSYWLAMCDVTNYQMGWLSIVANILWYPSPLQAGPALDLLWTPEREGRLSTVRNCWGLPAWLEH